jgi:hypothetical protein
LILGSEDYDPSVLSWRICLDVAKIQVQRDQYTALSQAMNCYHRILRAGEKLIGYCIGFESSSAEKDCAVGGRS